MTGLPASALLLGGNHSTAPQHTGETRWVLYTQRSRRRGAAPAPCRCSLQQFGSAELSRLPLSLETLHLDVYIAVPLLLPAALRLQELVVSAYHILVDWQQLCGQASAHRLGRA